MRRASLLCLSVLLCLLLLSAIAETSGLESVPVGNGIVDFTRVSNWTRTDGSESGGGYLVVELFEVSHGKELGCHGVSMDSSLESSSSHRRPKIPGRGSAGGYSNNEGGYV
jgi:hypothetical protein